MIYRVIGLMSGSSLDGLDIVFATFHENGGKWGYEINIGECVPYAHELRDRLAAATSMSALDYQLLHSDYGHYLGQQVNTFIERHGLEYKIALIGSHGHTTFHMPERRMTGQIGDGAAIAAETGLPVVTDLRALDLALDGQGAPIVPIGEKLLLSDYQVLLNLGGIANVSIAGDAYTAFDICPANRVLDILAARKGVDYDKNGEMAATGSLDHRLLARLNELPYYTQPFPKSLANDFGLQTVVPMIDEAGLSVEDSLATYAEHIAVQTGMAIEQAGKAEGRMLITGGGALNGYLIGRIQANLPEGIEIVTADADLINYKEALIMGLIAVLRWREEANVLSSVTGSSRDSVGGALWMGQEG